MDSFFSVAAFGMVVALLVVIVAVQQYQQNSQYREIQDRLREIRHSEMMEQQSLALRTERSAVLDPINMLEASLQSAGRGSLTPEELTFVDNARRRVKSLNDTLVGNRQWMGAPFDLEWHEVLERLPIVKKAYLAASFNEPTPDMPPEGEGVSTLTSFSGSPTPIGPSS